MKIRKNEWRCLGGKRWIVLAAALLLLWGNPIISRAEAKGVVIPNSVNIRKTPEQGSEVIGSSAAGKEIDIRGQVESGGITWYQVYIDANTLGYVRADMIEKKGNETIPTVTVSAGNETEQPADGAGEDGGENASQTTVSEGGAKVEAQEAMDLQYATTNVQAKVRPDPSTSNPHVDSLTPGTQVVVSGKSVGSDSKTWYYVTFTGSNGSERTGYIRSDLLELGEMLPMEEPSEEMPAEEPQEPAEPQVRNDYELKIETDSEGVATWYLYNNIKGEKEPLLPLLEAPQSADDEKETGALVKQRIVIVVLAVLLVLLVVAVVVLAFKLRDAYYEDDDEDDDEEDERKTARRESAERDERRAARRESAERDERRAARRENGGREQDAGREERAARRRAADAEGEPRRREGQGRGTDRQESRRREREVSYEEDAAAGAVRPASRRKTKNFLLDDDEFEFEFLNMDDKDLK